ncbi:HetZ-related protein [Microcoleus sp. FACHB-1515]|uniref:HetZ-related protein n=1 Tax=Cyanophyceae TaxID=3028117 RepID=UPI001683869C|nr:HetZ-related protein [Microcoleus sp. FACHB-1515]MBD2091862.1 HetZ-related protein [Microcoleus sp. FACHB-1515]
MNFEPTKTRQTLTDSEELLVASAVSSERYLPREELTHLLLQELTAQIPAASATAQAVAHRLAAEVDRVCQKSDRIQASGQQHTWQLTLARHRLQKCLSYYQLGSRRGRVELHSHLSAMVYRHVAPSRSHLGFSGRYSLIEDFLQSFYIEALKQFRREADLPADYSPGTRLELAEYMAFTEHYAKRRISLSGQRNQQLIVLRAQGFAKRQPPETALDMEAAVETAKGEDAENHSRSPLVQQVREQMVSEAADPAESVLRDRVVQELTQYLEAQGQADCADYLALKMQDLSVPEIDSILGLTPRQRDYLQQRFKYHVEKFARSHKWQLVHQWLGADLDQNLGLSRLQWEAFVKTLSPEQRQLLELKGVGVGVVQTEPRSDEAIAKILKCTPKQVHRRWVKLLDLAWQARNQGRE